MEQKYLKLNFVWHGGYERSYIVPVIDEITNKSLTASIAGIMQLFKGNDCPLLTDKDGKVFCIPQPDQLIAIEAEEYVNG
jgi:hypothetical protein